MAQQDNQLDMERLCCSICLDLLKDPVTIGCGHTYCMSCIKAIWDNGDEIGSYSCPECRQTFTQRPVLVKNFLIAYIVEGLKKTGLQAAPADHRYAGLEDVAFDFCTERKLKALKSCLVCLASYCQKLLQPHFQSPLFKKSKNICSRHKYVMQMFCRTEQQCIYYLCFVDENKTAPERTEWQSELNRLVEKRSSDGKQQIRSQHGTGLSRVIELQGRLEKEITELNRIDDEMKQLSHTEDHNQSIHSSGIRIPPLRIFEDMKESLSQVRGRLQDILTDTETMILQIRPQVDVLEPKTRDDFLKYSQEMTLDPNTANKNLLLSEGNRKVELVREKQTYSYHRHRFTYWDQVLSRESLTGRCYWEVGMEWSGGVEIAVAYKNIRRAGRLIECGFGYNDKSWSLHCVGNKYYFCYNSIKTRVSGPLYSRVGVYLDHSAGVLSFYSISHTMTLLHRVQTTFTHPLYAGVGVCYGNTARLGTLE